MNRFVVIAAALLVAACSSQPVADPAVERVALIQARQAFKDRTSNFDIAKFDCPAKAVSDQTIETMLLLWVNERTDLVTQDQMQAASNDFVDAFVSCGAAESQVAMELSRSDDTMMQGLVMAALKEGRGLQ
ncbi:hypothetical protein D3C72_275670 [compost metagenome]